MGERIVNEFSSERLLFRKTRPDDFDLVRRIFSNEAVMKFALMECIRDERGMRDFFGRMLEGRAMEGQWLTFLVFRNIDCEFIGFADFELRVVGGVPADAEIGYFLLTEYWGRGYATEIAGRLINLCFETFNVSNVKASCNALNTGSENVMKKCGMKKEATILSGRYKNGRWSDELRYGILKDEWEKERTKC